MLKLKFHLLLLGVFAASALTYAQEKRYPIGNTMNLLSNLTTITKE
ncbi:hypothetical protein [Niastella caeni]|nr:hypothetical protein [Niastella caeni]